MATGNTPCGFAIPQVFPGSGQDAKVDMQFVRDFVHKAETLGYDSLWVQETILSDFSILEPVTLLTYVAAVTSKLKLGTSVMLTTLRNPLQLAKALSSLDQMSAGRLIVGIGGGGHISETLFGYSKEHRMRRFVEGIEVMKALWTEPQANYIGTFWQLKDAAMEPKPVQKPHPPIWFGARSESALRRAVRHGDGWMGAGSSSSADFVKQYGQIQRFLDESQRDPASFTISKRMYIAVDNDRDRAERRLREWFGMRYKNADMGSQVSVWGSRQECIDKLGAVVQAGAQHLMINPAFDDMEQLEIVAQDIVPHV